MPVISGVTYVPIDGEIVAAPLFALLHDIRHDDGVEFNVNEGKRTKARQQELIDAQGLFNAITNPHGAAAVSDDAPHILTGRWWHAIDVTNSAAVIAAAARRGIRLIRSVATEIWHLIVHPDDHGKLLAYAQRHPVAPVVRPHAKNSPSVVRRLKVLLRHAGFEVSKDGVYGPKAVRAVRAFQAERGLAADGVVGERTWKALKHANPVIRKGNSPNDATKALKRLLNRRGHRLKVDGRYGLRARRAVLAEKRRLGLPHDTIAGPQLWRALRR